MMDTFQRELLVQLERIAVNVGQPDQRDLVSTLRDIRGWLETLADRMDATCEAVDRVVGAVEALTMERRRGNDIAWFEAMFPMLTQYDDDPPTTNRLTLPAPAMDVMRRAQPAGVRLDWVEDVDTGSAWGANARTQ